MHALRTPQCVHFGYTFIIPTLYAQFRAIILRLSSYFFPSFPSLALAAIALEKRIRNRHQPGRFPQITPMNADFKT